MLVSVLEENEIEVMDWPAQSPDFNHLQSEVDKQEVYGWMVFEVLLEHRIPQNFIDSLFESMPRKMQALNPLPHT